MRGVPYVAVGRGGGEEGLLTCALSEIRRRRAEEIPGEKNQQTRLKHVPISKAVGRRGEDYEESTASSSTKKAIPLHLCRIIPGMYVCIYVWDVVLALTHGYNAVRGHRTGSNT